MRVGCVCAKCGGGTHYIACAIDVRDAVAVTIPKVILFPSLIASEFCEFCNKFCFRFAFEMCN